MTQKPKFRYNKTRRLRSFFERQAKYESSDIDKFREHVEEGHARRLAAAHRRVAKLPDEIDDFLFEEVHELDAISRLADELSIVALYRAVEVNTARIVVYEFGLAEKAKASRIESLEKLLWTKKGLKLDTVPYYRAIDELRLLNNAIKHAGIVTETLANKYPRWHKDKPLSGLDKAYKRLRPKVPIYILRLAERMKLRSK